MWLIQSEAYGNFYEFSAAQGQLPPVLQGGADTAGLDSFLTAGFAEE